MPRFPHRPSGGVRRGFVLLEILIALFIQMVAIFTLPGALLILVAAGAVAVFSVHFFVNWFVESFMGMGGETVSLPVRGPSESEQLESLSVKELEERVQRRPGDREALRALAANLKARGEHQAWALRMEQLLEVEDDRDLDALCMKYHRLCDGYLGPLASPGQARSLLDRFIRKYPGTPQAELMRNRRDRIARPKADAAEEGLP